MTSNRRPALEAMAASADPGTAAAARHALEMMRPEPDPPMPKPRVTEPPSTEPVITKRGGRFVATGHGSEVRVAVREGDAEARAWVRDRRRLLISFAGKRQIMVPTDVEVDDERQRVYVTASADSLLQG
jgi:hypothetical protein